MMRRFVEPPTESGWEFPDPGRSQEQAVLDAELRNQLRRLVSRLAPKLRDALLLAATGEHTMEEIAVILGIPTGTVKWRIAEARKRVKVGLEARG